MACRIGELVLDCRDPEALARSGVVLDFVVLDREDDGSVEIGARDGFGGSQPTIILSRNENPEKAKPRLHIDVSATDRDQDAELERLLTLGATSGHRSDRPGSRGTCSPIPKVPNSVCCEHDSVLCDTVSPPSTRLFEPPMR